MTMTVIDQYNVDHANKPHLGKIAWYSVHDLASPHATIKAGLEAQGLGKYTPKWPAQSDLFRRVTKAGETSIPQPDGTTAKVMVRDVTNDKDRILRKVVVETVDAAGARLDYSEMYDLEFRKATKQLVTTPLTWSESVADIPVAAMQGEFAHAVAVGEINAEAIRQAVKKALEDNQAIPVRPTGGVFFVPRLNVDVLDALQGFADGVEELVVHSLPLLDEPGQPEMVAGAVADTSVAKADELSRDLAKMLAAGGEVSERTLARIVTDSKKIRERLIDYQMLLGDDLAGVGIRLDVLEQQVQAALLKMKVEGAAA